MKALFFYATAGKPSIARALEMATQNTLRPFHRFLGQAIHTARQRQVRYKLLWERVRNLLTLRLDPVDSLLRVPRKRPGVVLIDWPAGKAPDLSQPGFVINRGVPFRVEAARPTAAGLRVHTDPPLLAADRVIWCEVPSVVQPEPASTPPRDVTDLEGQPLKLLDDPRANGDRHWLLLVEGAFGDCELVVDGEQVEAEVMPSHEELSQVVDVQGRKFLVSGGALRVDDPPADGLLVGDNGLRYRWSEAGSGGRKGNWVQLLPSESAEGEDFLDQRVAFCEGDVSAIWTQERHQRDTTFKVKKVDKDRYQLLLDRYPPEGSTLHLPVEVRNLYLQKRALRQLADAPLPHHEGLIRLCEDPEHAHWPRVQPLSVRDDAWRSLTDASRSGTDEQRAFVNKALGTPDFAFLEGPPGSGKTTAICEIVQQLVEQGQRVLLCASTHVAIDNVLERLLESRSPIDAVRIGHLDKVDDNVQASQLDARIEALVSAWRGVPAMKTFGDAELREMAERTVVMAANLTCGTTMGIVNHPLFRGRDEELHRSERPITSMPHWDVLIIDEASKTLIQEFLVPALMARRWIVVGDVRQLPPFTERADIVANLRDLVDEHDLPVFPRDHQRACLLLFRLLHRWQVRQPGMRWLLVEPPGVLEWLARELKHRKDPGLHIVRVVAKGTPTDGPVTIVTLAQLRAGAVEALHLLAADWLLVGDDLFSQVAELLPSNVLFLFSKEPSSAPGAWPQEGSALFKRQAWWLQRTHALERPYQEKKFRPEGIETMIDCQTCELDWFRGKDLAQELAWRLTRLHELRRGRNEKDRVRLHGELVRLQPVATSIEEPLAELEDIGLPSILEVLQEGIGKDRVKRRSALTAGLKATRPADFSARFESLSYQHRMHPDIATFPREVIYEKQSLKDANTIRIRDESLGWDFGPFRGRRVWAHVDGRDQAGVNPDEVRAIADLLKHFFAWAQKKGRPERSGPDVWEVACLCFYVKQEHAISDMLREYTKDDRKTRFRVPGAPVEIVCGTVDRFQGREADLVMLSMRNTGRIGFLDSPNRLNVGVTRARQQLVVFGNHRYFARCGTYELEQLAGRTPLVEEEELRRWRRGPR